MLALSRLANMRGSGNGFRWSPGPFGAGFSWDKGGLWQVSYFSPDICQKQSSFAAIESAARARAAVVLLNLVRVLLDQALKISPKRSPVAAANCSASRARNFTADRENIIALRVETSVRFTLFGNLPSYSLMGAFHAYLRNSKKVSEKERRSICASLRSYRGVLLRT